MTITIAEIQIAVANFFHVPLEEVTLHSRRRVLAYPRPIAMFLARQLTGASLHEIAHQFNCRSFKIARSLIARVEEERQKDVALDLVLKELSETLAVTHEAFLIVDAHKRARKAIQWDGGWYRVVASSHRAPKPMAQ